MNDRSCNRASAFTLMELMVVVVLIAIMAAVIVPEMKGSVEEALLRASARKVLDVCNLAYSRSISLNQLHRLRLDQTTGHYVIEKQMGEGQEDADFEPVTDVAGVQGEIDPRISIQISRPEDDSAEDSDAEPFTQPASNGIGFYPDG